MQSSFSFVRERLRRAMARSLLALAAARNAAGEGVRAAEELAALVERAPAWIAGHEQLAQLLSTLGQKEQATQSLERAIVRFPGQESLVVGALWNCPEARGLCRA